MEKAEQILSLLLAADIPAKVHKDMQSPWVLIDCKSASVNNGLPLALYLGHEDGIPADVHAMNMIEQWRAKANA